MLYINLIAGYNVYVKVMTDDQDKYSFLIMGNIVMQKSQIITITVFAELSKGIGMIICREVLQIC